MGFGVSDILTLVQGVSLNSHPGGRYSLLSGSNVINLAAGPSRDNVVNLRK